MTTRFVLLGLALAVPAQAQRLTLGANFGGSSANADLGSSTGWKSGWSAGANLTAKSSPERRSCRMYWPGLVRYRCMTRDRTARSPASPETSEWAWAISSAEWGFGPRVAV